jgi:hypothetical protein
MRIADDDGGGGGGGGGGKRSNGDLERDSRRAFQMRGRKGGRRGCERGGTEERKERGCMRTGTRRRGGPEGHI